VYSPALILLSARLVPLVSRLSDSSSRGRGWNRDSHDSDRSVTVDFSSLGAVTRDVTRLAATVAGLASGVERATVGSSAVAGNVA
jgi:hypothetical protein